MNASIKNILGIALILFLGASFVGVLSYVHSFSLSNVSKRTFDARGEGRVVAIPDIAKASISIVSEGGKNLSDIQKENTDKANRVIAFLKKESIDSKDIQTQSYSVNPRYETVSCPQNNPTGVSVTCPPAQIAGYSIEQSLQIKIRDLNKIGTIMTKVVDNGANRIWGPDFSVDDPTQLRQQALSQAIEKAITEARALAKAGHFSLGRIISISQDTASPWPIAPMESAYAGGAAVKSAPPQIEPGSQEVKVNVSITYEIR